MQDLYYEPDCWLVYFFLILACVFALSVAVFTRKPQRTLAAKPRSTMASTTTPETLEIIPAKARGRVKTLMNERAVLTYSFSFKALWTIAMKAYENNETKAKAALQACVLSYSDSEEKKVKEELNTDLAIVLNEYGQKTLRTSDPFGRTKDFLMMEGVSTSFNKQKAMDELVRKFKLDAAVVAAIFEKATSRTSYVTVQARDVKESDYDEKG